MYQDFIHTNFPHAKKIIHVVLGGYNLNRIAWHMNVLHNPYLRFNFSGLISIMNPVNTEVVYKNENVYRSIMIDRDIHSRFWDILHSTKPQAIILDFIEERFDVIKIKEGYVTKSDALSEATVEEKIQSCVKFGSKKYDELWKTSCRKFIQKIENEFPFLQIILVENYLSESMGNIFQKKNLKM